MINRQELVNYLDDFLQVSSYQDYCHNGLQVQGPFEIKQIATGVSANLAFIQQAAALTVDAVLTHHGLFWKGDAKVLVGVNFNRVKALIQHDINLLSYHLPLDAHQLGNNKLLGDLLGVSSMRSHQVNGIPDLLWTGELKPLSKTLLQENVADKLGRQPLYIKGCPKEVVKKIAWCSGAAQDYITIAKELGAEVYLSGEISERTVALAKELEIDYLAAGHHATERLGIYHLGEHLAQKFQLKHTFIDIDNPV